MNNSPCYSIVPWIFLLNLVALSVLVTVRTSPADLVETADEGQIFPVTGVPFAMPQWPPATQDGQGSASFSSGIPRGHHRRCVVERMRGFDRDKIYALMRKNAIKSHCCSISARMRRSFAKRGLNYRKVIDPETGFTYTAIKLPSCKRF